MLLVVMINAVNCYAIQNPTNILSNCTKKSCTTVGKMTVRLHYHCWWHD